MTFENILPKDFVDTIKIAIEKINEWNNENSFFNVFTHLDADGLASGGIICSILKKLEAPFRIRVFNQLTEDTISTLKLRERDVAIFTDFGSSQKDMLKRFLRVPYIIIDHHQPKGEFENSDSIEINPHYFGIDGSSEISSSGLSYLLAKNFSSKNVTLSTVAIVGALGDRQDCGENFSLIGLNKLLVSEAVENKLLDVKIGLRLFGFESRSIVKSLEYTIDPLIPGLSGDFNACMQFLKSIGISPIDENGILRRGSDLSSDETRKLIVEIIKYMLSHGVSSDVAESIIGTVYTLIKESPDSCLRDAREFSSVLNACGRMGFPSYGLALCMGIRGVIVQRISEIAGSYRKEISRMLNWFNLNRDRLRSLKNIYFISLESNFDEKMLSTFISIIYSSKMVPTDKPIVSSVLTRSGKLKISCRAERSLVKKGINLGLATRLTAEAVGGIGGGHDVAAGAEIPSDSEEQFLKILDEVIGKQISGGNNA
ncbi:MAG: DHH family phosphoesterase [Candidatus Methanomethylicia archaeon]